MKRQLDDYYTKFYQPLAERSARLYADNYAKIRELVQWKELVAERWDNINVVSIDRDVDLVAGNVQAGKEYKVRCVIDEQGLDDAIGIEIVTLQSDDEGNQHVCQIEPLQVVHREGNLYTFEGTHSTPTAGDFKIAYRMFPKNDELPHRQDFCYVKWFN